MRRGVVIAIRSGYVFLIVLLVLLTYPALRRAKVRGGPTAQAVILYNLQAIEGAKEVLKEQRGLPDDYWPTHAEIADAYRGMTNSSFSRWFPQTRWGEIYIINRIGAPAYAYFSNSVAGYPEGYLLPFDELLRRRGNGQSANGSQPSGLETNRRSAEAGARR